MKVLVVFQSLTYFSYAWYLHFFFFLINRFFVVEDPADNSLKVLSVYSGYGHINIEVEIFDHICRFCEDKRNILNIFGERTILNHTYVLMEYCDMGVYFEIYLFLSLIKRIKTYFLKALTQLTKSSVPISEDCIRIIIYQIRLTLNITYYIIILLSDNNYLVNGLNILHTNNFIHKFFINDFIMFILYIYIY